MQKSFIVKSTAQDGLKKLTDAINSISKKSVYIGVTGETANKGREGELNNAQLMAIHEFGAEHIPERAPIRNTMSEKGTEYGSMFEKSIERVLNGEENADVVLNKIGAQVAGDVVAKIQSGLEPALSPQTIKRKGSDVPLVDTGALIQSITYEVK